MDKLKIENMNGFTHLTFELSSEEADMLQRNKEILSKYLDLEVLFDQVIEEFWEYKNKVDYWRLRSVSKPIDYVLNHEIRSSLNRLAFNLLNLGKAYLDIHYHEDKKRCFSRDLTGSQDIEQSIIDKREELYNNNLGYVIACKIRNNSQHRNLPISTFTTSISNNQQDNKTLVGFNIFINYEELIKFKVPKEKLSNGMKFEFTEAIEGFAHAISEMHMQNRTLVESSVKFAKSEIEKFISSKASETNFEHYMTELELISGQKVGVDLEWFEVAEYLKRKHPFAIDYSRFS